MKDGKVIAGVLAPHPPHLVYAENPPQNEPRAECGWEVLRWGYEKASKKILDLKPDVLIVHSPHWPTYVGYHFLGLPKFQGLSVDPVFPHLFRYKYDIDIDVDLSLAIRDESEALGLETTTVKNPDFRLDYGSIISLHMINKQWDIPVIMLSANQAAFYFSDDIGTREALKLGEATRKAVLKSGKRAVVLSSCSMSHRHFVTEPDIVEDMSFEHIHHHGQYLWDMKALDMMKKGHCRELLDILPEFNEQATSEFRGGSLAWMLGSLQVPSYPAEVHAYGSVIGTGNAVVSWVADDSKGRGQS